MSRAGKVTVSQTGTGRAQDNYPGRGPASVQVAVTGTVNYTVQWSNDGGTTWTSHETLAGLTASAAGSFLVPVEKVAVLVNSGSGTAAATVVAGIG